MTRRGRGAARQGTLLFDRNFGPWFWGNLGSNTGSWLFNVTAAVVIYDLTAAAFLVGLVSVAQFAPLVVLAPWAGALCDRFDRRRLLLWSQSAAATAAFAIAVPAVLVGVERLGAVPILVAAFGIGVSKAFGTPAVTSLVPFLVADHQLENGISLTQVTYNVGRAAGPVGAGLLLVSLGPELAFFLNAVSFLGLIAALLVVRERRSAAGTGNGDGTVRAGLRHVVADRRLLLMLAGVATVGFAADPVITLAPPIAREAGGDAGLTATMVSAFGILATLSALVSGRLLRRYGGSAVAGAGTALMAAGLVLAAAAWHPAVPVAGFAVTGTGFTFGVTAFTTLTQRRVPDAVRGRVMALWSIAFLGTRPVAAFLHGGVADLAGPRAALFVAVAVAVAGTGIAFVLGRPPRPAARDGAPPLDNPGAPKLA